MKRNTETTVKYVIGYFAYLLIIWGFYRLLFQLPEEVEELLVKPVIWLLPLFYIVILKEKNNLESVGITFKNLFPAVYFAFALGAVFVIEAVIVNYIKYGALNFGANIGDKVLLLSLVISFVTAFSEEIAFRGYIFGRFSQSLRNEILANIIASFGWTAIHLPVTFFVWKLDAGAAVTYLVLTTIFGIGSAFVFARTKNIFSSILLHVLWQWPIILFR